MCSFVDCERSHRSARWLGLLWIAAACVGPRDRAPDIRSLYAAAARDEIRNPVIVIHGILGARLEQRSTGKVVFGAFDSTSLDPSKPDGARALALPLEVPASARDYDPSTADVVPTGPLERFDVELFYGTVSVDVYAKMIRALGIGGFRDPVLVDPSTPAYADDHYTCYTFFYDWRRDNVENAIRFGAFVEESRTEIEARAQRRITKLRASNLPDERAHAERLAAWLERGFRFDVVAHSMGGLIARYYLRHGAVDLPSDGSLPPITWAGSEHIDRLVMVGTPNLGAIESLQKLVLGFAPSYFLPEYDVAVLGSMPSIYQLMPRVDGGWIRDQTGQPIELDFFDVEEWDRNGWGLLSSDAKRVLSWLLPEVESGARRHAIAKRYLAYCLDRARRFQASLDRRAATRSPTHLIAFAGDAEPTAAFAEARRSEGGSWILNFRPNEFTLPGDGTVTRASAIGDLRPRTDRGVHRRLRSPVDWERVFFLRDDHLGLTSNPTFVNNLLFQLLEEELPPRAETSERP